MNVCLLTQKQSTQKQNERKIQSVDRTPRKAKPPLTDIIRRMQVILNTMDEPIGGRQELILQHRLDS